MHSRVIMLLPNKTNSRWHYFLNCTWYAYTPPTSLSLKPPIRKRTGVIGVVIVIVAFAKIITTRDMNLVLVLDLIKDNVTIKRMLSLRHPYTRDLFLRQSLKN